MQMRAMLVAITLSVTALSVGAPASVRAESTCGVDAYESNDKRSRAKSTRGKPVAARVCAGDDDWFYFKPAADQLIEIVVEHPSSGQVTAALFPPGARKSRGERTVEGRRQVIRFRPESDRKHRLKVYSTAQEPVDYTVTIGPAP